MGMRKKKANIETLKENLILMDFKTVENYYNC